MSFVPDHILEGLKQATGLDLSGYRRDTLQRRLAARMARLGLQGICEYEQLLAKDPSEYYRLGEALVIQVSSFFRDPIVFEILIQNVLPRLIEARCSAGVSTMRVWCAGCATGEEAYSVAICIHEVLKDDISRWTAYVFATDVSREGLEAARRGIYPREKLESTRLGIFDRYFIARGPHYEVQPHVRAMVHFSRDDLLSKERFAPAASVFGTFDIVLCRNVLIYLREELQHEVMLKLSKSLARDGFLVLGTSESLSQELAAEFAPVDQRNRVFRKVR